MKFSGSFVKKFKLLEGTAVVVALLAYFFLKHKFGIYYNISCEETSSSSRSKSNSGSEKQSSSFSSTQSSTPQPIEDLTPACPDYFEMGYDTTTGDAYNSIVI